LVRKCILLHCKKEKKITAADPAAKFVSASASLSDTASTSNISVSSPPADDAAAALDACKRNELGMVTNFQDTNKELTAADAAACYVETIEIRNEISIIVNTVT